MNEQFAKSVESGYHYEYIVSAAITESLMAINGLDGIMYLSVTYDSQYIMNDTLHGDVADSKLILEDINEMESEQLNGKGSFFFIRSSIPLSRDDHDYL